MLREHALTYQEILTVSELEYLCTKANKLGLKSKSITRMYQEEDAEGKHIYFEVVSVKSSNDLP